MPEKFIIEYCESSNLRQVTTLKHWLSEALEETDPKKEINEICITLDQIIEELRKRVGGCSTETELKDLSNFVDDEIKEKQELIRTNQDLNERWAMGLSGAGILLTIGKFSANETNFILMFAWIQLAASIILSIFSGLVAENIARHSLKDWEECKKILKTRKEYKEPKPNDWNGLVRLLNTLSPTLTITGISTITFFAICKALHC